MLSVVNVAYVLPDGRHLFQGIDLSLEAGEAVAIEGPSGSGKSTLLAIIGGMLTPTTGRVDIEPPLSSPSCFAWVLQGLNSLGARNALDNAALYSLIDGMARSVAERTAREHLDELGLGDFAYQRVRQLSGGEVQRVAVARALSSRRPFILADEPTNQLDRENARLVMSALIASAEDGRAVLVVTHDHDALPSNCKVLRLEENGLHAV